MQITDKGIIIDRLNDIHTRLQEEFKGIYGQDINLAADTPDGQMIGIFSQAVADLNEIIAFVVQMLNPYEAAGKWLEVAALYAGVIRRGAEYSYLNDVAIIGDRPIKIPKGAVLIDSNRVRWITTEDVQLDSNGSARTVLRSEDLGAFELQQNEELKFETVYVGVRSATTLEPAQVGKEEEQDPELLKRFMMSHSVNNSDDKKGLQAALAALPDVKKASVLENYENKTDPITGLPGHSLNAIVVGGDDEDIAQTLLKKKVGGSTFIGEQEVTVLFDRKRRKVRFDRAAVLPIKVGLVFERLKDFTDLNEDEIKEGLIGREFEIGEDVHAMRLVCGIDQSYFSLKEITVNGGLKQEIGLREYAVIKDVEITIIWQQGGTQMS